MRKQEERGYKGEERGKLSLQNWNMLKGLETVMILCQSITQHGLLP